MPNYRRAFVPGGCWFFTVNLLERRQSLLVDRIDSLRDSVARTHDKYPFEIDAFVVLPDHIHAIWTLPPGDADFSTRWRLIKTAFATSLPKREHRTAVRNERGIWQRRFWEHVIRNETDDAQSDVGRLSRRRKPPCGPSELADYALLIRATGWIVRLRGR
jgi:putative transposase